MDQAQSIDIVVPSYRLTEDILLNIINLPKPAAFKVCIIIIADNPNVVIPDSLQQMHQQKEICLIINDINLGFSASRNKGIRAGDSKWILLIDDDVYPQPDLLKAYAAAIEKQNDAIGFVGITYFPEPFNNVTKALSISGIVDHFKAGIHIPSMVWAPTANIVLNRKKMDTGLFDENLKAGGEDIDFLTRNSLLHKEKYLSVPAAVVTHPWWNNGRIQTKRMINYGAGASQIARKEPVKRYTYIDFTNSLETILLLLLLYPFAIAFNYGYIITTLLLAVPLAEYITNWLKGIIKGKTYDPLIAFHLLWIKNCYEFGFLYTSLKKGYLGNFARRIEMGFNKPNPSPFRLNRWKIIKLILISMLSWLILWGRT